MMPEHNLFPLSLLSTLLILSSTPAQAQIIPDNTLGAERSIITPNVLIKGANADLINGGAIRGSNLFQSFSQFNINNGQRVYFGNPTGIENILTRVTGGNASNILGTLGVNGTANLFFINPNGILFGPNASLDIRGSFVGTTANAVQFGNLGNFSATNPQAPPALLTIHPSALAFNQLNQGAGITIQSYLPTGVQIAGEEVTGLRVPDGKSLLLVGGNVNVDGGGLTASGGRVELASLAAPGSVGLNIAGDTLSLSVPSDVQRGNISLTNGAFVNVTGAGGGDIAINAQNVDILGGSMLSAGIGAGLGTSQTVAGDITLNGTGEINIAGAGSGIANNVGLGAVGNGGNINITADSLSVSSGIGTNVSGAGNGGNINITADSFQLNAAIFSNTNPGSTGNAGKVNITADSFQLTGGAIFSKTSDGTGNAGDIILNISHLMTVSGAYISAQSGGTGNGGKISINANQLKIENTQISTNTTNTDKTGEININVTGDFTLQSTPVTNTSDGTGNGGGINIKANSLDIEQGGTINTVTTNTGNAGDINIDVKDTFNLQGGDISVNSQGAGNSGIINIIADNFQINHAQGISANSYGTGNGGKISINANQLQIENTQISTNTMNTDKAGEIDINVTGDFTFNSSGIVNTSNGTGNGGLISIKANSFNIQRGGIDNSSESTGNAGDININVKNLFSLQNGGIYDGDGEQGTGSGGIINISAGNLQMDTYGIASQVSAGKGGDININVKNLFDIQNVLISSNAITGSGGIINISADNFQMNSSVIDSVTQNTGNGGDININVKDLFYLQNSRNLPTSVTASTLGNGKAGDINLFADQILLNGAVFIYGNVGYNVNSTSSAIVNIVYNGANTIPTISLQFPQVSNVVGDGGNIKIDANSLSVTNGAQITTSVENNAVGNGGTIDINTNNLTLTNGAQLVANNLGQGNAGNIIIKAANEFLIDGVIGQQSSTGVFAESQTAKGGDITLAADLLVLRRGGLISSISNVEGAGGIDGNIDINTNLLVAVPRENSDIIAVGTGRSPGSNIQVSSEGIFGTQIRNELTPESDIVATGEVTINQPQVQPTAGLLKLPEKRIDASNQLGQLCPRGRYAKKPLGEFVVTGHGSLPPNLLQPMTGTANMIPLATLDEETATRTNGLITPVINHGSSPIIEAQGFARTPEGKIIIVADASQATPSSRPTAPVCPESK